MTYLDQKIMFTINSNEFLEQAWMKSERKEKAPHIVVMTKRFNDVSEGIYRLDRTVFFKDFFLLFYLSNPKFDTGDFFSKSIICIR